MATQCITCPRCSYDLSGAVATWGDACPLRGVCSECGYDFDWGLTLRRASGAELALYEVAMSLTPYALIRSIAIAFRPAALWREAIRGEPIRPKRLAIILGAGMLTSHLLVTLILQITILALRATGSLSWETDEYLAELALTYPGRPVAAGVLVVSVLTCALMLVAAMMADDDRFRPTDVARAGAYWLVSVPLLAGGAELLALIDPSPLALHFSGGMRSAAREAGPVIRLVLILSLYGWVWYWWMVAFSRYFRIPSPRWRAFMATGGWIVVAAIVVTALSALMEMK